MTEESIPEIFLQTGDFHFGNGRVRLRTLLGSCVALTLWHPHKRLGGMCHYLLPSRGNGIGAEQSPAGFYADEVIELLSREAQSARTQPRDFIVKLFGGGNMFDQNLQQKGCAPEQCVPGNRGRCRIVPCRNVLAAQELLKSSGFTVHSADTGGNCSRQVMMDLWSGDVWLRHGRSFSNAVRRLA